MPLTKLICNIFFSFTTPHACKTSRNIQGFEDDVVEQRNKGDSA